jgi:hypothetical protein
MDEAAGRRELPLLPWSSFSDIVARGVLSWIGTLP